MHKPLPSLALFTRWLGWWVFGVLLFTHPSVGAKDYILEKSYWTDTTGAASFEQARQAQYTPYVGVLSKGFSQHVQWIRLKIDTVAADTTDSLVLRIRPVFLDSITLYDPAQLAHRREGRITGDRTPLASTEFESLNHAFVIPVQPAPRDVWLRLFTSSTQLMHVEALTPREMLREEHFLWLAYSALLALLFSCLLWVFISWLQDRDHVNGVFVLRQTILIVYTACYLGYHRILLDGVMSAQSQDLFYGWTLLLSTTLTFVFEYRLLQEYAIARWGRFVLLAGLLTSFLALVLMLLDLRAWALPMNTLLVGLGMLCMFVISLFIRSEAPAEALASGRYLLPKRAISVYYGLAVVLLAVSIMPSLALIQGTLISIYGVLLYGLLSGLVMTALLIVRSRQMERLRREQINHLFLSREQLAIETRRRQDQSQLLNMLMHELKTPLAVIDMAQQRQGGGDRHQAYVVRAIDNMKGILDRCVQTDRMVERHFEPQLQRVDMAAQLQQWLQDRKLQPGQLQTHIAPALMATTDLQCAQIIANNLIDNAIKYGAQAQAVLVSLHACAHADGRAGLLLGVANLPGAAGWPAQDKLFGKYYRSSGAQSKSGTGLGLYLSHNLATQLGGELRYRPDDQHIRFELWLPT